jgi:hypothetical protein
LQSGEGGYSRHIFAFVVLSPKTALLGYLLWLSE